jgi:curved DNA-binding protein CbpA
MNELDHCYRILGLEPGASVEEVNQAYKDLAFIWHPDRVPSDNSRLREKAAEKLKEINHARDLLRSARRKGHHQTAQTTRSPSPAPQRAQYTPPRSQERYSQRETAARSQSYSQTRSPNPDLSGADFRGADLKEKDLSGRNLSHANLSNANLSDSFLHKVNLQGANLEKANLFRANLFQANLNQANLRDANLIGADLSGADLSGADLRGAKVGSGDRILVKLTGANLSGAILPDGRIHA